MLLEEMAWVAADFIEERHWKRAAAWRLARDACDAKSAEKKATEQDKRKLARQVAVQISSFWRAMERIAARYQTRSSPSFDRHISVVKDHPSTSSPRHLLRVGALDGKASLEWMRTGGNPRVRDVVVDLMDTSKRARDAMKANSAVDDMYAHLKLAQFQWNALQFMVALNQGGHNILLNDQLDAAAVFGPQLWQAIVIEDMGQTVDTPLAYTGLRNVSARVVVCEMALDQWASDRTALWGEFLLKHTMLKDEAWNVVEWDDLNLAEAASVQRMMKHAGMPFKDESSCLQIALRALTLGRLRNDMEAQLGKVEEQTVACCMTPSQLKYYNNAVTGFNATADKDTVDHWLRLMLRLRAACNGVDVLHDFDRLSIVDRAMLESCSAKLKAMMELVDRLVHQDKVRVVVYVQSDVMLPAVEYAVTTHLNIPCVR
ncbi:hypothetical protein AaE_003660, partial [Aphanomyces astaci]